MHATLPREGPSDRPLALAALLTAVGAILSGPVGMALAAMRPQPQWKDAETFAAHFHPVQQLPYEFGFLLVGGCVFFVARAAALATALEKTRAFIALAFAGAFAAMIVINYTLQISFVPSAARAHDPALAYVAMANPAAVCWAFEMFGYALLGVATWLIAPVFRHGALGRLVRALLIANGVASVTGAVITAIDPTWVMSTPGLMSFALWNVLLIGTMILVAVCYRPRRAPGPGG